MQAIGAFPTLINARVAFEKISSLDLAEHREAFGHSALRHDWQELTLEQVSYRYPDEESRAGFAIGPIDLTLMRGEVVFLIGGNGSGKSTLARLLTGLYQPKVAAYGSMAGRCRRKTGHAIASTSRPFTPICTCLIV